jgi:hypothetical protein
LIHVPDGSSQPGEAPFDFARWAAGSKPESSAKKLPVSKFVEFLNQLP